ncbi:MAG: metalloregulator ArsR/SmtB family transcription factor [Eubacterium sp.]
MPINNYYASNIHQEEQVTASFHVDPIFEMSFFLHILTNETHHVYNKTLFTRMRKKITPKFLEEILALEKITWSWIFPTELMHYMTIEDDIEPFEVMIEKMDKLSDASFCAVAFPYNKVSRSTLHKWMKKPELILDIDENYLPEYVNKQTSYDFLCNIKMYRNQISQVFRELWETVFKEEWPYISGLLSEELKQKKALFEKTDLSTFINSIHPCISFQNRKYVYSDKNEKYPGYNHIFEDFFINIKVYASLFCAPHYFFTNDRFNLVVCSNIILENEELDKTVKELVPYFKAFADETRLKIICMITEKPMTTKMLADELMISPGAVSRHLKQLTNLSMTNMYKVRQEAFYSISKKKLEDVLNQITLRIR